jgi:hypothetical protein
VCGAPFAAAVEKTLALPENEREQTIKVAAFDLDGTLVVPKQGVSERRAQCEGVGSAGAPD